MRTDLTKEELEELSDHGLLLYIATILSEQRNNEQDAIRKRIKTQQLARDIEAAYTKRQIKPRVETTYGAAETMPKI